MTEPGDVLDLAPLGARVELRRTAAETDGTVLEFDVVGRARGLLAQPHLHPHQVERLEVMSGSLELTLAGSRHRLAPGQVMEVPPQTTHRQRAGDAGEGRVRVQLRPAGRTQEFLERLAEMSVAGDVLPGGWPRPLAAAALVRDFADVGHAAYPPLRVQQALAGALLRASSREYLFVDEWDVAAPSEATFAALADARTYRSGGYPCTSTSRRTGRRRSAGCPTSTSRGACPITCARGHVSYAWRHRASCRSKSTVTCAVRAPGR